LGKGSFLGGGVDGKSSSFKKKKRRGKSQKIINHSEKGFLYPRKKKTGPLKKGGIGGFEGKRCRGEGEKIRL